MKISNFWLLIILSLTITSCAILGGQSPEKIKKNNTFYIYSNVEGAKIEVLNKPEKENFEPTYSKSGSGFYSVNTYSKLRLGRTKLLISKEGYEPDTIKIRRAPRPGVLTADICFFGPLVLLDILSPNFYKISKKSSNQNVYLSPTQEFMRLKYNEISEKSDVAVFDNFINEFPNSDCVSIAKSRRDTIVSINSRLKESYVKAISTKNPIDAKEFLKNCEKHSDLITEDTKNLIQDARSIIYKEILTQLSTLGDETKQNKYIEETIIDLKQIGDEFSNAEDLIYSLLKSSKYNGEVQLYGQKITQVFLTTWLSSFRPKGLDEKKDFEQTKELLFSADNEQISLVKGKVKSISGIKNGDLLFRMYFSQEVSQRKKQDYIKYVKDFNESSYTKSTEKSAEFESGFRYDNILLHVFLVPKLNADKGEYSNIRFVELYCPDYGEGGEINSRIKMNYSSGFFNQTVNHWNFLAEDALVKGRTAEFGHKLNESSLVLFTIIRNLKSLQLVDAPSPVVESIRKYREVDEMIEEYSIWDKELDGRRGDLPWDGYENNNQGKSEKTTNFCFEDDYTGEKHELKLSDFANGEGKVVFNRYRRGVLEKTITGYWKEQYVGFGDATNVVIDWDGANAALGQTKYFIRKYASGGWQDLQSGEFEGKKTWTYCNN